jgi:uncharacterized protein HemX
MDDATISSMNRKSSLKTRTATAFTLLVLAIAGWLYWRHEVPAKKDELAPLRREIVALQTRIATMESVQQSNIQAQTSKMSNDAQRLGQLEKSVAALSANNNSAQSSADLAEFELLLTWAKERYLLTADAKAAATAMGLAQARLDAAGLANDHPLRLSLAAELQDMQTAARSNWPVIIAQLAKWQTQCASWPLAVTANQAPTTASNTRWWQRYFSIQKLDTNFALRQFDQSTAQAQIAAEISAARIVALRADAQQFRLNLESLTALLQARLNSDSAEMKSNLQLLQTWKDELTKPPPALLGSTLVAMSNYAPSLPATTVSPTSAAPTTSEAPAK